MLSLDDILAMEKEKLPEAAKGLDPGSDLPLLVGLLSGKDDKLRYQALLLLQYRSAERDDVYPFLETFCEKLKSENSYQRSIGLMLLAANARWDADNRLDCVMDDYLAVLKDEKPTTVRQCIQSLAMILPYKKHLHARIAGDLMALDLTAVKDTMRKSVLTDVIGILAGIRKNMASAEIDAYISNAFASGILDRKTVKQLEILMK